VNAGEREIVWKKEGEEKGSARGSVHWSGYDTTALICVCVLLLQDLLQSCARGGRRRVEDMCYERRRAEACVDESAQHAQNLSGQTLNK
jgi:hypothetical protein